ncbi:K(lysine) acetyltransferase [Mycoemilia scoparia]|uniref:histone acetyltransferase n=1 Tax=Mycoemilia scoparia TaxID=417184 RepID=A0A9W7ZZS6_9FUNG|nr:K(lysine) acetyltransferase [Mycoemilia scoparia]
MTASTRDLGIQKASRSSNDKKLRPNSAETTSKPTRPRVGSEKAAAAAATTNTNTTTFTENNSQTPVVVSRVADWATPAEIATRTKSSAPSSIKRIFLGQYNISTWYHSPYPEEYRECEDLYICECCLKYMKSSKTLAVHSKTCEMDVTMEHLVYEDDACAVYVLDAKDHKEKVSMDNNNLACILVLPPYRGQQYGRLLIELSYEITKLENQVGGPERPLSGQGFLSYRSYWRGAVLRELLKMCPQLSMSSAQDNKNMTHASIGNENTNNSLVNDDDNDDQQRPTPSRPTRSKSAKATAPKKEPNNPAATTIASRKRKRSMSPSGAQNNIKTDSNGNSDDIHQDNANKALNNESTPTPGRTITDLPNAVISVQNLAISMGFRLEDVLFTLEDLQLLKYWHGKHILCLTEELIQKAVKSKHINLHSRLIPAGVVTPIQDDESEKENDSSEGSEEGNDDNQSGLEESDAESSEDDQENESSNGEESD